MLPLICSLLAVSLWCSIAEPACARLVTFALALERYLHPVPFEKALRMMRKSSLVVLVRVAGAKGAANAHTHD